MSHDRNDARGGVHISYCVKPRGSNGWQVRLGSGGAGRTKFFADSQWGGADESYDAADAYARDAAPLAAALRQHSAGSASIPGIRVYLRTRRPGGRPSITIRVNYTDADGDHRSTSISVDRHGIERAAVRAVALRRLKGEQARAAVQLLIAKCEAL